MSKVFPLVTENIGIDIINTEVVRWGVRQELLENRTRLHEWIVEMAKHNKSLNYIQVNEGTLQEILLLRSILLEEYTNIIEIGEIRESCIDLLQYAIVKSPFTYKLVEGELVPISASVQAIISLNILQLIAANQFQYLRRCENEQCVLWFFDRTGRRKWCSMDICGNRKKVKKHSIKKKNVE